jgi:hypothetical protein
VPGVDHTGDGGGEHDATTLLQPDEGVPPIRHVRADIGPGDRNQPAAGREAVQRRCDMPEPSVLHASRDMRHRRKRRVHQHDGGHGGGIEMIVDLRRVETRYGNGREERCQQLGARIGKLVQDERAARRRRENGEQPGSGRWFQHTVGRRDRRRRQRSEAQRQRR